METGNRRLIRPPIDLRDKSDKGKGLPPAKKQVPPEQTNAENFYYVKQMQAKTPMVFVLKGGETLHGVIEWYDKTCLKVNREEGPNILLYKANIAYMYKDESEGD